jgi:hypothetical protein
MGLRVHLPDLLGFCAYCHALLPEPQIPATLITFVWHCEVDAHYQMAIAAEVQILPLTRQLTVPTWLAILGA